MADPPVALARLDGSLQTRCLTPCNESQTSCAIERLKKRAVARRQLLAGRGISGAPLERALCALRRLQSPHVRGYYTSRGIVVSEPFGAVPAGVRPAADAKALVRRLVGHEPPSPLCAALAAFGQRALNLAVGGGVRILLVPPGKPFASCSQMVASLVPDIDRWNAPPAGLFVLEERLILLRNGALRMAAAHEFAHSLDALLAQRVRSYFSFENQKIRAAYAGAGAFVNEYASSGLDEYFAESLRAYVEVNDDRSAWLPLTRHDLKCKDPAMFAIVDDLFRSGKL